MENMDTDIRVWQLREDIKKNVKKKKKKTGLNPAQNIANLHEELLLTGTAVLQLKQGKEKKNVNFSSH